MTGPPVLVLGSTQLRTVVDDGAATAAGIEVGRRSTGGGAVLVAPDAQVWLDLWVPRGHALWDDDVVRAAFWLGDAWAQALAGLGVGSLEVHRGPALHTAWSDRICFAGMGPGELSTGGAKVMGLAQRRTRDGARFHSSAHLVWDPGLLLGLLDVGDGRVRGDHVVVEGDDVRGPLDHVAVGLRALLADGSSSDMTDAQVLDVVEDAVLNALP